MILPIIGISTAIPTEHDEIIKKLIALGIQPTGNIIIDRARLTQAIKTRIEKQEEIEKEKEIKEEKNNKRRNLEEQRIGAETLANQNKIFFNIK